MPELRVNDFSGGITDNYLDAPPNYARKLDHFIIDDENKALERPGSEAFFTAMESQLPSGNQRVDTIWFSSNVATSTTERYTMFMVSNGNVYFVVSNDADYQSIRAKTSFTLLGTILLKGPLQVTEAYDNHFIITSHEDNGAVYVVYPFGTASWKMTRAGFPPVDYSGITITPSHNDGKTYIYYFVYFRQYVTNSGTFWSVYGDVVASKTVTNAADMAIGGHTNLIQGVPKCDGSGDLLAADGYPLLGSYPTDSHVLVFRTQHNGTIPYLVNHVSYSIGNFSDAYPDSTIDDNEKLYTYGGVYAFTQPYAKHATRTDRDIVLYGATGDNGNTNVIQAVPGTAHAAPEDFNIGTNHYITAIGYVGANGVIFEDAACFRLGGSIDSTGRGALLKRTISSTIGCRNGCEKSLVNAEGKLFFLSNNGFCFTDGYEVYEISTHLDVTFGTKINEAGSHAPASVESFNRIYGVYSAKQRRIFWDVPHDDAEASASNQNNTIIVLDLSKPLLPDGSFTMWPFADGGGASALAVFYDGRLIRGDKNGYIYIHDDSLNSDPYPDTGDVYANWNHYSVVPEYISPIWSFGTELLRKWITKIATFFDNFGNLGVQLFSENDKSDTYTEVQPVLFEDGSSDPKIIRRTHRMPRGKLRCTYKSIRMVKGDLSAHRYQDYDEVTVTGHPTNTAVLNSAPPNWPAYLVGMVVYFETDSYTQGYTITGRTDDTVNFSNPGNNVFSDSSAKWFIKGVSADQKMRIIGYTIPYSHLGDEHEHHEVADSGTP